MPEPPSDAPGPASDGNEGDDSSTLRKWGGWILRLIVSVASIYIVLQFVPIRDRVQLKQKEPDGTVDVKTLHGTVLSLDRGKKGTIRFRHGGETKTVPLERLQRTDGQLYVPGFLGTWRRIDLSYALPAFLLLPLLHLIGAYRWKCLLRAQHVRIRYLRAVRITFIGYFWNNLSLGLTGGDIAKAYLIGRKLDRKAGGILSVFVDRFIGLVALLTFAFVASLFRLEVEPIQRLGLTVGVILILLFGGLYVFFHPSFRRNDWVMWIRRRLPFPSVIRATERATRRFKDRPYILGKAFLLSAVIHGGAILMCALFGSALGITAAGVVDYCVYYPIATVISALPISASGWGIGEAGYVFLFGLAGVAGATALSLSVLIRLTMVLWSLPGALLMTIPIGNEIRVQRGS